MDVALIKAITLTFEFNLGYSEWVSYISQSWQRCSELACSALYCWLKGQGRGETNSHVYISTCPLYIPQCCYRNHITSVMREDNSCPYSWSRPETTHETETVIIFPNTVWPGMENVWQAHYTNSHLALLRITEHNEKKAGMTQTGKDRWLNSYGSPAMKESMCAQLSRCCWVTVRADYTWRPFREGVEGEKTWAPPLHTNSSSIGLHS